MRERVERGRVSIVMSVEVEATGSRRRRRRRMSEDLPLGGC